jgi:HEAT repeat protein
MQANADAQQSSKRLTESDRRALLDEIRSAMKTETGWTRIRAGEALIGQGHGEETLSVFRPLVETAPSQERIGVWRVLAQAEPTEEARRKMVERIWQAFLDPKGSDRVHAVEALAKLRATVPEDRRPAVEEFARPRTAEGVFARWLLALSGDSKARKGLLDDVQDRDWVSRLRAAYSLSQIGGSLSDAERKAVINSARSEPEDSSALLTLAFAAARVGEDPSAFRKKLVESTCSLDPEWRRQAAHWLSEVGIPEDLPALSRLSKDESAAVRMAAANARLKIDAQLGE